MKFAVDVLIVGNKEPHEEIYDTETMRYRGDQLEIETFEQAKTWVEETVNWFNETLKPRERRRELVGVRKL